MGGTIRGPRAQTSIEYLLVMSGGLGIVVAVAYVLLGLTGSVNSIANTQCYFDIGVVCSDLVFASNSATTMFALLGSNSQEYAISGLSLSVSIKGVPSQMQCTSGKINPGQPFVCFGQLSTFVPAGTTGSGSMTAHVGYCGINGGDCGSAVAENYAGKYSTSAIGTKLMKLGITFGQPVFSPSGQESVSVLLNVFGQTTALSTINLTSGSQIQKSGNDAYFVNASNSAFTVSCSSILQVSYAGLTANELLPSTPTAFSSNTYTVSSNNQLSVVFVNSAGVSVTIGGNNNNLCMVAQPGTPIKINIGGNGNAVTLLNGNAALTVSGGKNNLYLENVTVTSNSITGANDKIIIVS